MNKTVKKVLLIVVLLLILGAIIFVVVNSSSGKKEEKVSSNTNITKTESKKKETTSNKTSENQTNTNTQNETEDIKTTEPYAIKTKIEKLDDGVKYSVTDKEIKPDIVVGDNYFGTQIADMSLNFDQYEGKTIEIEGLYFENAPYTFVGRYSTSVVCPTCPTGYSYFEYEWHGDEKLPVSDSQNWIKVLGTLKKGNDGVEYYYIDVASIELMNEKGLETVSN